MGLVEFSFLALLFRDYGQVLGLVCEQILENSSWRKSVPGVVSIILDYMVPSRVFQSTRCFNQPPNVGLAVCIFWGQWETVAGLYLSGAGGEPLLKMKRESF